MGPHIRSEPSHIDPEQFDELFQGSEVDFQKLSDKNLVAILTDLIMYKHDDLKGQAIRDKATSMPLAMSKAMEMRHVKAEELIVRSVISVIRSNQFYHRLMLVLIQDTKAGVDYDPERVKNLIPKEFTDMVSESILSTNLEGLLSDLAKEVDS